MNAGELLKWVGTGSSRPRMDEWVFGMYPRKRAEVVWGRNFVMASDPGLHDTTRRHTMRRRTAIA